MSPISPTWRDRSPHGHLNRIFEMADGIARIRLESNRWHLFCPRLGISGLQLQALAISQAQDEALSYMAKTLVELNLRLGWLLAP